MLISFLFVSFSAFFFIYLLIGKSVVPKTVNDVKLIHLGKVLENNKTLSESGVRDGAFAGGVITMHVVIQPVLNKKKSGQFFTFFSCYFW